MINEKQLALDVEEFFNEEDISVGMYAVGKIDENVVNEFQETFDSVSIVSYDQNELEFDIDNTRYKIALSSSYERWVLYRVISL